MKLALKQDSPEKQKKTIEHFIRRQKAHQQRKEITLEAQRTEQDRSLSGRFNQKTRNGSRSNSKRNEKSQEQGRGKSNTSKIDRLTSYIEKLKEENDFEGANEFGSKLNFYQKELSKLAKELKKRTNSANKIQESRSKSPNSKPTYRGGGQSSYIPYQYRQLGEKQSAFAQPTKQEYHAGAIDPTELPYGTFIKERDFQNKVSKELTEGYTSRYSKDFIMKGGDKIDTIRQEIDNLLHNKKKLDVFGREKDEAKFISPKKQKDLLYGMKMLPDGSVSQSKSKSPNRIKFFEGYRTQNFNAKGIEPKQGFEIKLHSLKETIDEYEARKRLEADQPRIVKTTILDMSPKKFRQADLTLQMKQLDLDLERQIRDTMNAKF